MNIKVTAFTVSEKSSNVTADPGAASPAVPYFRRDRSCNDYYGHSLPSADSRRVVISYKRKNVHEVLAQEKVR